MKERAGRVDYDGEQYHAGELLYSSTSKKRLDLNDLLRRAKDDEKRVRKLNLLIYSCATSVVVIFLLLTSI